ncbi:CHRD domain-containing protein [Acetobacter senegalensis]|uniref:CHRD domain-containing protein n=1 Tax=Acetobacter senegalensis TaxID=446692 RepID=UPI00265716A1|nr:CHRD domain-containing protein [Acetobacter senegalensis]MDN7349944.1 CHRD domain-containing protein [Acetobacter senegalensis]
MISKRTITFSAALLTGVLAISPVLAHAETISSEGHFAPQKSAGAEATGGVRATLETRNNLLSYTITWNNLSGPVVAAELLAAKSLTDTADKVEPLKGPFTSPLSGTITLSADEIEQYRNGQLYVSLGTAAHPHGEVRAQLTPAGGASSHQ